MFSLFFLLHKITAVDSGRKKKKNCNIIVYNAVKSTPTLHTLTHNSKISTVMKDFHRFNPTVCSFHFLLWFTCNSVDLWGHAVWFCSMCCLHVPAVNDLQRLRLKGQYRPLALSSLSPPEAPAVINWWYLFWHNSGFSPSFGFDCWCVNCYIDLQATDQ